jgi:hypothetical protein
MRNVQRIMMAPILAAAWVTMAHGQELTIITPEGAGQAGQVAKHEAEISLLRTNDPGEPGQEARQKVIVNLVTADHQVVKGKPYAADASTETVQTLADGNRIENRTVSKFYRDSQGRTRREQTFGNVDPSSSSPHEMKVFIDDPVSGSSYVVDPGEKSVRQLQKGKNVLYEKGSAPNGPQAAGEPHMTVKFLDEHAPGDGMPHLLLPKLDEKHDVVKEELGKKVIEGVECTGTQQTITIPVGEVGNERPISIVTETWYSPAIAAVVQSSTSDPRFGQTTYQLRNLQVSEQQRQLFEPPSDYRVETPRK